MRVRTIGATRLTCTTCAKSDAEWFSIGPRRLAPALLMSTSTLPKLSSAASMSFSQPSISQTSVGTASAWPPSALIAQASSSRGAAVRAASTTLEPSLAKARAAAAPIPVDAPVMITVQPLNFPIGGSPEAWPEP
uniref:Transcription factor RelB-like protein n=1 Tax=uncultured organism TaxID=155900 RepID=K7NAI6_9ZZZZ|nr:transcription factor RelB-like protein [uncultured organism]